MKRYFLQLTFCSVVAVFALAKEENDSGASPTENIANAIEKKQENKVEKVITDEAGKKIDDLVESAKDSEAKDKNLEDFSIKNGFLLGTGMGLKEINLSQIISGFESLMAKTPSLDIGLLLGYQHYFNQYVGLRISGMIHTGGKAQFKYSKVIPATKIQEAQKSPRTFARPRNTTKQAIPATTIQDIAQTYYPIKANTDLKVLVDIFTKDKHSVGLNVGIGYEIEWLVVGDASAEVGDNSSSLKKLIQKPTSLTDSTIYPTIGLHYFYGKHQFELEYKFAEYAFVRKSNQWNFNTGKPAGISTTTKFSTKNSLSLNYIYRF